jgi:hypothetical protein
MTTLSRRQLLAAAAASGVAMAVGQRPASAAATPTSTRLHPDWVLLLRGFDSDTATLYAADLTNETLRQSTDWAQTWSAPKTLPPASWAGGATRVIAFGDRVFCAVHDLTTLTLRLYASPAAAGDTPFTWTDSGLVAQPMTSAKSGTQVARDATYLYVGEYGDPPNGPSIYRSADGANWQTVFSASDQVALIGRTCRHVHAVAADPLHPGHVYVTTGDFGLNTGAALWRSTSSGDPGTWEVVLPTGTWQSSQISFDAANIWLSADNHRDTAVVIDRATMTARTAASTHQYDIPVPGGAPGDAYWQIASHGHVDADTGIYYCVGTTGTTGNTDGMFAIPSIGAPVSLVDPGGIDIFMRSQMYLANGCVWSGQWYRPLLPAAAAHLRALPGTHRGT